MLSRTADHFFWMARYAERAENTARMLEVSYQTALLSTTDQYAEGNWRGVLEISELSDQYFATFARASATDVIDFMVQDPDNPSSMLSCVRAARENARAVRGVLPTEVWETLNATWLDMNKMLKGRVLQKDPVRLFDWIKLRSHLLRGVQVGTMLRDEAYHFTRLGTFLERADNTARILDVKFQRGTPHDSAGSQVDVSAEFYYWASLLRSLSGFEIYRRLYRDAISSRAVVELLVLREDMPRSLAACTGNMAKMVASLHDSPSHTTVKMAGRLYADLKYGSVSEIFAAGLHEYLETYLSRVNELGERISRDFLVPFK